MRFRRNTRKPVVALLLALLFTPGCATAAPEERRAYVLARPHAWVELTIADPSVPDVPVADESETRWERPHSCFLQVEVDGEPWFSGSTFPQGEVAPYTSNTGFRFPVPVGPVRLRITYGGCRVESRELRSVVVETDLKTEEALVYDLTFDGAQLAVSEPRADSVVTLEDVYEAITGRRSPTE